MFKKLPPGWKFRVKTLDKDLIEIPEGGVATIMPTFFNVYDKTGRGMTNTSRKVPTNHCFIHLRAAFFHRAASHATVAVQRQAVSGRRIVVKQRGGTQILRRLRAAVAATQVAS
jgi:hypothetical protein